MTIIDTPDNQAGVVSAQILLANISGGASVSTGLPPNSESLVILGQFASSPNNPIVTGNTTGTKYPVIAETDQSTPNSTVYVATVSPAADAGVTITWFSGAPPTWQVIADSGVRITADAILNQMRAFQGGGASITPGIQIFGSGPTGTLQAVQVDAKGRVIASGPNLTASVTPGAVGQSLLAAPAAGTANYIYGVYMEVGGVAGPAIIQIGEVSGAVIGRCELAPNLSTFEQFNGYETTKQLLASNTGGTFGQVIVHYRNGVI